MNKQRIINIFDLIGLNVTRFLIIIMATFSFLGSLLGWGVLFADFSIKDLLGTLYITALTGISIILLLSMMGRTKFYCYKRFLWVSGVCIVATFILLCAVCYWHYTDVRIGKSSIEQVGHWEFRAPDWLGGEVYTDSRYADECYLSAGKVFLDTFPKFADACFTWPIITLFCVLYFPGYIRRIRRLRVQDRNRE